MSYLGELLIQFPIHWRSNLKMFNFVHFLQKNMMEKNEKIGQNPLKCENWSKKNNFPESDGNG